jgi:hypothetical protein
MLLRYAVISTPIDAAIAPTKRRIDNERSHNPERGRAGLKRAQLELSGMESQLRLRGLLE